MLHAIGAWSVHDSPTPRPLAHHGHKHLQATSITNHLNTPTFKKYPPLRPSSTSFNVLPTLRLPGSNVWPDYEADLTASNYTTDRTPEIEATAMQSEVAFPSVSLRARARNQDQPVSTHRALPASLNHERSAGIEAQYSPCDKEEYKRNTVERAVGETSDKALQCPVPNCGYQKAFSGQYELDRHLKGQHYLTPSGGDRHFYQCAESCCPSKTKLWSRLDKFRKHTRLAHPELIVDEHIKRSIVSDISSRNLAGGGWQSDVTIQPDEPASSRLWNDAYTCAPTSPDGTPQHGMPPCAGATVINPFAQPERHQAIREMIALVNKAFSAVEQPWATMESYPTVDSPSVLDRDVSMPSMQPPASFDGHPWSSAGTSLPNVTTCGAEILLDGDDGYNANVASGHLDFQPSGSRTYSLAGDQRDQKATSGGQDPSHNQTMKSKRKRMDPVSSESGGFPCVFHRNGMGRDLTVHCANRKPCVSELRKHHEHGSHSFYYCTKCFVRFPTTTERTAHEAAQCSRFKCVTDGCRYSGTYPNEVCQHNQGSNRRGNTQRCIWRELFRLARPGENVPEFGHIGDSTFSPSTLPPSSPMELTQATPRADTSPSQLSEVLRERTQSTPSMIEIAPSSVPSTPMSSDPEPPSRQLIATLQGVDRLNELFWGLVNGPPRHATSAHNQELIRNIEARFARARFCWIYYRTPWILDDSDVASLRGLAFTSLPGRDVASASQHVEAHADPPPNEPPVRAYRTNPTTSLQRTETTFAQPRTIDPALLSGDGYVNGSGVAEYGMAYNDVPNSGTMHDGTSDPNIWRQSVGQDHARGFVFPAMNPNAPRISSTSQTASIDTNSSQPLSRFITSQQPSPQAGGSSRQTLAPAWAPFTQQDTTGVPRRGEQQKPERYGQEDPGYGSAVDEGGFRRPAGRLHQ